MVKRFLEGSGPPVEHSAGQFAVALADLAVCLVTVVDLAVCLAARPAEHSVDLAVCLAEQARLAEHPAALEKAAEEAVFSAYCKT